jgi:hypothetical protein
VLLEAGLIFEMLCAVLANAFKSFLGHLSNVCKRLCAGGVSIIHLFRKLLEFSLYRLCRAPLGEYASILVSIKIAFLNEGLPTITPSLCQTVMLLAGMSVAVIGVGKRFAAEAAQDGDVVLSLAMVHEGVLAHKRRLVLRAEVADETFAMSVLDVFLQFFLCFATHIALLALVSKASLTVDVLFRLTREFFAASFARHGDGQRASLIRAVRHCSAALGF